MAANAIITGTATAVHANGERPFMFADARGSDLEIGRTVGSLLSEQINHTWNTWASTHMLEWFGTSPKQYQATADWLIDNLEPLAPWMVEQMRGIAIGAEVDFVNIVLMNHYAVLWPACGLFCTSIAFARSDSGRPILAQNLDIGNNDLYFVSRLRPSEGYATLSDGMYGMCWSPTGMNEHGLAIGSSNLPAPGRSVVKPLQRGVPCTMIPRMTLRRCATTSDAVDYIQSLPPVVPLNAGYQINVIDAEGQMAVIDKVGTQTVVRQCSRSANWTTNVSLDVKLEEWRVGDNPKFSPEYHGYQRSDRIRRQIDQLKSRPPAISWIKHLMSSHDGGGGRICRHGPDCDGGYSRLSMLYSPVSSTLDITNGPPCRSDYQHFSLQGDPH